MEEERVPLQTLAFIFFMLLAGSLELKLLTSNKETMKMFNGRIVKRIRIKSGFLKAVENAERKWMKMEKLEKIEKLEELRPIHPKNGGCWGYIPANFLDFPPNFRLRTQF